MNGLDLSSSSEKACPKGMANIFQERIEALEKRSQAFDSDARRQLQTIAQELNVRVGSLEKSRNWKDAHSVAFEQHARDLGDRVARTDDLEKRSNDLVDRIAHLVDSKKPSFAKENADVEQLLRQITAKEELIGQLQEQVRDGELVKKTLLQELEKFKQTGRELNQTKRNSEEDEIAKLLQAQTTINKLNADLDRSQQDAREANAASEERTRQLEDQLEESKRLSIALARAQEDAREARQANVAGEERIRQLEAQLEEAERFSIDLARSREDAEEARQANAANEEKIKELEAQLEESLRKSRNLEGVESVVSPRDDLNADLIQSHVHDRLEYEECRKQAAEKIAHLEQIFENQQGMPLGMPAEMRTLGIPVSGYSSPPAGIPTDVVKLGGDAAQSLRTAKSDPCLFQVAPKRKARILPRTMFSPIAEHRTVRRQHSRVVQQRIIPHQQSTVQMAPKPNDTIAPSIGVGLPNVAKSAVALQGQPVILSPRSPIRSPVILSPRSPMRSPRTSIRSPSMQWRTPGSPRSQSL